MRSLNLSVSLLLTLSFQMLAQTPGANDIPMNSTCTGQYQVVITDETKARFQGTTLGPGSVVDGQFWGPNGQFQFRVSFDQGATSVNCVQGEDNSMPGTEAKPGLTLFDFQIEIGSDGHILLKRPGMGDNNNGRSECNGMDKNALIYFKSYGCNATSWSNGHEQKANYDILTFSVGNSTTKTAPFEIKPSVSGAKINSSVNRNNVTLTLPQGEKNIRVLTLSGKSVYSASTLESIHTVPQLHAGSYVISVEKDNRTVTRLFTTAH